MNNLITKDAWDSILLGERKGIHGRGHWLKVASTAYLIASKVGGDTDVAMLFGVYHDCRRLDDGIDKDHGLRASELIQDHFDKGWLSISEGQRYVLQHACKYHSDGLTAGDLTTASCWDADRLDLPRVGVQTDARYLTTDVAKKLAALQFNIQEGHD